MCEDVSLLVFRITSIAEDMFSECVHMCELVKYGKYIKLTQGEVFSFFYYKRWRKRSQL